VRKAISKLYVLKRKMGRTKIYATYFLYLPSKLISDSTFPLKEGEKISIAIKGDSLVAEPIKRKRRKAR
jgi:hypothetical protein